MGAELTWVNQGTDGTTGAYEWKGTTGTNSGLVTCGANTYTVAVTVATVALKAVVGTATTDGVPACAAGAISLDVRNWDSTASADSYTMTFVCMVCGDSTCTN